MQLTDPTESLRAFKLLARIERDAATIARLREALEWIKREHLAGRVTIKNVIDEALKG